jgi:hypothetical protein
MLLECQSAKARSLRIAVVVVIILVIFLAVAFVLLVVFLVWLLSQDDLAAATKGSELAGPGILDLFFSCSMVRLVWLGNDRVQ